MGLSNRAHRVQAGARREAAQRARSLVTCASCDTSAPKGSMRLMEYAVPAAIYWCAPCFERRWLRQRGR